MKLLDNVLGSAGPAGMLAKPLMRGLTALFAARATGGLGDLYGGGGTSPPTLPVAPSQPQGWSQWHAAAL
jgi:hypothetical protein